MHFNSRPYVRGDQGAQQSSPSAAVFQFTPLREGRPANVDDEELWDVFQFTPLREGRLICHCHFWLQYLFQFTPLREGRLYFLYNIK